MTSIETTLSLPLYTPSAPSPSYTCGPTDDEQTLQQTPISRRPPPADTYTKEAEKVVVTLFEQEKDAEIPTYGRHAHINGTIYLGNLERVSLVVLEGDLHLASSEGGFQSIKLINDSYTLWNRNDNDISPTLIPFSCVLPSSYERGDSQHPLPPSYSFQYAGAYTLMVDAHYCIKVCVERDRYHLVGSLLTTTNNVTIPFTYYPRVRPHRPIHANPNFFSTIKLVPEEWFQALSDIKPRPESDVDAISCHLFIPVARVYGLSDTIPFHVQLSGSLNSIESFLMLSQADGPSPPPVLRPSTRPQTTVRVYLLRHVSIEIRGYKSSRNTIIAEAQLREIPPTADSCYESPDIVHLDWEGELSCSENIIVGGFTTSNIVMKDFIGIGIKPLVREREAFQFMDFQMNVPIRLVTDPFVEATDYDRG